MLIRVNYVCSSRQGGRVDGRRDNRRKVTITYVLHPLILPPYHTHTHTHTHAPLFFANLSPLPSLPLPTCRTCTHPTHRGSKVLQHLFLFLCLDSLHTSGSRATWTQEQLTEHRETVTHRAYSRGSSEQISEWGYKTEDRGQRTEMEWSEVHMCVLYVHTCETWGTQSTIIILYILYTLYINVPGLTKPHFAFLTINWLLGALTTL